MRVFYIKFQNGDEIIAQTHKNGKDIVIQDPMTLEYGENEGRRFIFMTRYNPFLEDKTIRVRKDQVLFMKPVMAEVSKYYFSSLDYSENVTDKTFKSGMLQASQYANEMTLEESEELEGELTHFEIELDSELEPSSNTVH